MSSTLRTTECAVTLGLENDLDRVKPGLLSLLLGDTHAIRVSTPLLQCLAQRAQRQLTPLRPTRAALADLLIARHRSHGTLLRRVPYSNRRRGSKGSPRRRLEAVGDLG